MPTQQECVTAQDTSSLENYPLNHAVRFAITGIEEWGLSHCKDYADMSLLHLALSTLNHNARVKSFFGSSGAVQFHFLSNIFSVIN